MSKSSKAHLSYEELIEDGNTSSVDGWDFSWFEGRATEERPGWGYAKAMSDRMGKAAAGLDIQTGGGEVLAKVEKFPTLIAATESWPPNVAIATKLLGTRGVVVVVDKDEPPLPFGDEAFDLVVSRHPVKVHWQDIARILRPGGTYFAQHVGPRSVFEVVEFFLGPQPEASKGRRPETAREEAEAAGLEVVSIQSAKLRTEFYDVGAIVHFLRKVVWMVPGFTVEKYEDKLKAMHQYIQTHGSFVAHTTRFLIEARKPLHKN
ncbi:hypothetical protein EMPS_00289 [Entomortierella parvispora]|uniref:Methyltransferase type 11 domain-containing protein n=1 Tax=Entomortierella parvispora TaxID=205924 RepID=A0A9P3LRD5_9FUNG|nr:hypothetical protein EMPS_00289 [Entomortierella parvispora]